MGVSAGLLPSKGMTLPFVSYGGSSILGVAIGMGLLLAVTRRRPDASVLPINRDQLGLAFGAGDRLGVG